MRIALLISLAAATQLAACVQDARMPEPKTDEEKTLYSMGVILADQLRPFDLSDQELAMVKAGLHEGAQDKSRLKPEDISVLVPRIQALGDERASAALEREKKAGAEFLAKAAAEPGAVKTESGMVYRSVSEGSGPSPSASDVVRVHYEGRLVNGKVFDSSRERDEPAEFALDGVIPCWTEGVQKMKVGGTARLVCPPELAYGEQGRPPVMPGGATLTFDVELLDIIRPDGAPAP